MDWLATGPYGTAPRYLIDVESGRDANRKRYYFPQYLNYTWHGQCG